MTAFHPVEPLFKNSHPETHSRMDAGPKVVRILFDEFHSESWTISYPRALEINPQDPSYSSYQKAADTLAHREFSLNRNTDHPLTSALLSRIDLLVLLHPCDPHWEKTTSQNSPLLNQEELNAIHQFVESGGSLLVVTEYEHDKYGDNLNELLSGWEIQIENTTVHDRSHCVHDNPTWILAEKNSKPHPIQDQINKLAFYQSGTAPIGSKAQSLFQTSPQAYPPLSPLIAVATPQKGRVAVVTDSQIFGDEYFDTFDHRQLWCNLMDWLSVPAHQKRSTTHPYDSFPFKDDWQTLKTLIQELRPLQSSDGSVESIHHPLFKEKIRFVISALERLTPHFPHQKNYFQCLASDFEKWINDAFVKPDFRKSLEEFHPEKNRIDEILHLSLFPQYTPNGSRDIRLEAILFKTPWPVWLENLEKNRFSNPKFVPGELIDFTEGYQSDCAVLFPETVSISGKPINSFGTIFCDREAKRLLHYSQHAIQYLQLTPPPSLEVLLQSPAIAQQTLMLWDLIHDQAHSLGELPFDPFMIRQRAPYWMYSLEELRVDLRAFNEAYRLQQNEFPFARFVMFAILLDRLFRFPIVGNRIRNYDGLGGQILFSSLHHQGILKWCDNRLEIDWKNLPNAIQQLLDEIVSVYRNAAETSKVAFWIDAHDLVSRYVRPNVASRWKKETRAINNEENSNEWLKLILDDEFPLGQFHINLQRKIPSNDCTKK